MSRDEKNLLPLAAEAAAASSVEAATTIDRAAEQNDDPEVGAMLDGAHQLASKRTDRAGLDAALDGDLREVCLMCGAVRSSACSDYYFPLSESWGVSSFGRQGKDVPRGTTTPRIGWLSGQSLFAWLAARQPPSLASRWLSPSSDEDRRAGGSPLLLDASRCGP